MSNVAANIEPRPYRQSTDNLRGYLAEARERLDKVIALFVYVEGMCGHDCSVTSFEVHDEDPRESFNEQVTMIAGYIREVEKELEKREAEEDLERRDHDGTEDEAPLSEAAEE